MGLKWGKNCVKWKKNIASKHSNNCVFDDFLLSVISNINNFNLLYYYIMRMVFFITLFKVL
jgi:hypothetical protein